MSRLLSHKKDTATFENFSLRLDQAIAEPQLGLLFGQRALQEAQAEDRAAIESLLAALAAGHEVLKKGQADIKSGQVRLGHQLAAA